MGILLTTTTKQGPTVDPFASGQFSKTIIQKDSADIAKASVLGEDIPFPGYLCVVMIDEKVVGLFQSISDIDITRELEPFSQGGENNHTQELPKGISYGHITLKSGYSTSKLFMDWMFAGQYDARPIIKNVDVIQGRPNAETGKVDMCRKWTFNNAFPVKWRLDDFGVNDVDKIVIEKIELTFEDVTVTEIPPEA